MGTLPYCSPEVCKGEAYNQKTDVWALGCILYEICTNRRAFNDPYENQIKDSILNGSIP
jgi:serine/threonine protein kinase